jgi:hypothetical protein
LGLVNPSVYLVEEFDARVGMASRFSSLSTRIEARVVGNRKFIVKEVLAILVGINSVLKAADSIPLALVVPRADVDAKDT